MGAAKEGWGVQVVSDDQGRPWGQLACYYRDGLSLCGRFSRRGKLTRRFPHDTGPCLDCLHRVTAMRSVEASRRREDRNRVAREEAIWREDVETGRFNAELFRFLDAQQ
jgi:hypothetical protein